MFPAAYRQGKIQKWSGLENKLIFDASFWPW